ncbi:histone-lysine N-methyltransferase SETMAR [Trichonephila clavipes]|nr:histone-lysine N-methyltransferase SETMAR [Trichonephila clavipes]
MESMREPYSTMILYDFKARLNQDKCVQWLQLSFGDESAYRATGLRWFKEFCRERGSLQDEEDKARPRLAVIPDNEFAIRKMSMDDSHSTYTERT